MSTAEIAPETTRRFPRQFAWDLGEAHGWLMGLGTFLIFFAYGAYPTPDSNESHYLGKARHFWNPSWCASDSFLNSQDAHTGFYYTVGWLAAIVDLPVAAWIGRIGTWALMAWAWQRLGNRVLQRAELVPLAALGWLMLNTRFHMAGEWVVGGFEAKGLALAFILFALAELVVGRWQWVFPLLGMATFLHVLVGGWAMLAAGMTWFCLGQRQVTLENLIWPLLIGLALALPAVLWGLNLSRGVDQVTIEIANQAYFERLPHHINPESKNFFALRHVSLQVITAILLSALTGFPWTGFKLTRRASNQRDQLTEQNDTTLDDARRVEWQNLALFVICTAGIAALGLILFNLLHSQPTALHRMMRYYWFRASDAWVPLGCSLAAWRCVERLESYYPIQARVCFYGLCVVSGFDLMQQISHWPFNVPLIHQAQLNARPDLRKEEFNPADWRAICAWIRQNTPENARFLTPRVGQTFKWNAQRAEVVTHKDQPQDAASIALWKTNLDQLYPLQPPLQPGEDPAPLRSLALHGPDRLLQLARQYQVDYILVHYRSGVPALPWSAVVQQGNLVLYDLTKLSGSTNLTPLANPPMTNPTPRTFAPVQP